MLGYSLSSLLTTSMSPDTEALINWGRVEEVIVKSYRSVISQVRLSTLYWGVGCMAKCSTIKYHYQLIGAGTDKLIN